MPCTEIAEGRALDVLEIDAGSIVLFWDHETAAAGESEWIDLTGQPPAEGRLGGWVDAAVGPDAGLAEQVVYLRGLSSRTEYLVRLTPLDGSDEPLRGEQHTVRLTTLANGRARAMAETDGMVKVLADAKTQ